MKIEPEVLRGAIKLARALAKLPPSKRAQVIQEGIARRSALKAQQQADDQTDPEAHPLNEGDRTSDHMETNPMDNMKRVWAPRTVPEELQAVLAVEATWPITPSQHESLMRSKIVRLFEEAGPREAHDALEMSEEHFPEMALIARNQMQKDWPDALMDSDTMGAMLARIKWAKEGPLTSEAVKMDLLEQMEEQSLRSLIESL
jgi:hypothetical protein